MILSVEPDKVAGPFSAYYDCNSSDEGIHHFVSWLLQLHPSRHSIASIRLNEVFWIWQWGCMITSNHFEETYFTGCGCTNALKLSDVWKYSQELHGLAPGYILDYCVKSEETNGNWVCILLLIAVDHQILLKATRKTFGIHHDAIKWISSYLSGRTQSVVISDSSSQISSVKYGVPQGSVLGPLLFILYTGELEGILLSHVGSHLIALQMTASCSFSANQMNLIGCEWPSMQKQCT